MGPHLLPQGMGAHPNTPHPLLCGMLSLYISVFFIPLCSDRSGVLKLCSPEAHRASVKTQLHQLHPGSYITLSLPTGDLSSGSTFSKSANVQSPQRLWPWSGTPSFCACEGVHLKTDGTQLAPSFCLATSSPRQSLQLLIKALKTARTGLTII